MIYVIIFYIVPALTLLVLLNHDVFIKKERITYGEYIGTTCVALTPIVNFVAGLFILSYFISNSELFDKFFNFLDKRIN